MFHRIAHVKALPDLILWVEFSDRKQVCYRLSALLETIPQFRDLENIPGLFELVQIDPGGYGVSWNDDLDLSAEELYSNGKPVRNPAALPCGHPCPTCGQMIRRKSEAQQAASRANLAKRKSKGGRPVNPDSKRQQMMKRRLILSGGCGPESSS